VENLPTLIDREIFPGFQGGPHMHSIAAKAVAFHEAAQPEFKEYAQAILDNAQALAKALMGRGFKLVTNGTDNHLIMIDIPASVSGLDGRQAQDILDQVGLSTNCNAIPNDPLPPYRPSGLRIGTPAITTRGLGVKDMDQVAVWMQDALKHHKDEQKLAAIAAQVRDFALQFPLPSDN
jgi:glycine hydroxymethyltransferase